MKRRPIVLFVAFVLASSALPAFAADVVERKSTSTPVTGEITSVTRDEITLTTGSLKKTVNVPANDVVNVRWDKEPAQLNLLRGDERAGRLQKAIDGYNEALKSAEAGNKNLRADVAFMVARATAKMALADPAKLKDAVSLLDDFIRTNSSSFRYYVAVDLLGQLYVSQKNFTQAKATYALLRKAPWPDYQMSAQIAEAHVLLESGDVDGALTAFNQVASAEAKEPAEQARRLEALIGKAVCLQKKKQPAEAAQTLDEVIRDAPADETAIQAEAYLRQGDSLREAGQNKAAVLAYLHVELLFPQEEAFHAEALYRLSEAWKAVGNADRAAQAASRLQDLYPNSEWAKQR